MCRYRLKFDKFRLSRPQSDLDSICIRRHAHYFQAAKLELKGLFEFLVRGFILIEVANASAMLELVLENVQFLFVYWMHALR